MCVRMCIIEPPEAAFPNTPVLRNSLARIPSSFRTYTDCLHPLMVWTRFATLRHPDIPGDFFLWMILIPSVLTSPIPIERVSAEFCL